MTEHIQIGDISPRIQYTVIDPQKVDYTYPFPIFKSDDLEVYLDDALQSTGYLVTGAGNDNGGLVIFDTAPAENTVITLNRNLAIQRTTDFQEGGDIRADTLNDELNYQTASIQQISDDLDRTLRLAPTAPSGINTTLPEAEAGKVLIWNSDGTALENSTTTGFSGPEGPEGPAGADGLFTGTEDTVTISQDDKIAILDESDGNAPKFITHRSLRTEAATDLGALGSDFTLKCSDGLLQYGTVTDSLTLSSPRMRQKAPGLGTGR